MAITMQHLNCHQMCAIHITTTGPDPSYHELLQIAIVPLDSTLKPRQDTLPFFFNLKPDFPERIDKKYFDGPQQNLMDILRTSYPRDQAIDILEQWVDEKLHLPFTKWGTRKKIVPLGYLLNTAFIVGWLGHTGYNEIFHHEQRDLLAAAAFLNEQASFHAEKVPFSKLKLSWLAYTLNVSMDYHRDPLIRCTIIAECYRRMVSKGLMVQF